jgi:hypothetical protein
MAVFFVHMVQLHPEDNHVVVVEAEMVDLVIAAMKVQAWAQDPVTLERPSSWTYSMLKEFKTRIESRKTTIKYS